jgi:hypothetical protein
MGTHWEQGEKPKKHRALHSHVGLACIPWLVNAGIRGGFSSCLKIPIELSRIVFGGWLTISQMRNLTHNFFV